jgi:hypothetical protein
VKLEHGEITEKQYEELKRSAVSGKPSFSKDELIKIFKIASPFLERLKNKLGKQDIWDMVLQQEFWHFHHNRYLMKLQDYLKKRGVRLSECMVLPVEVIDFEKGLVRFRNQEFIVKTDMVSACRHATKHYDCLVEELDGKTYRKMLDSLE